MNKNLILTVLCLVLLLSGCTVKENQLVVLEKTKPSDVNPKNIIDWELDPTSLKTMIEKNRDILDALDESLMPIITSPDYSTIFAFQSLIDETSNENNTMVITGNMIQPMELFAIKAQSKSKKSLGRFLAIKSFQFNDEGNYLSFIDGEDNVYIYDIESEHLQKVLEKYKYRKFNNISWSRDSKRLMFDNRLVFDIASKEFLSIAADNYTPFIKRNFNENIYIVEMKNDKYDNIVALYNFDNRSYTQIANGFYMDSDNISVLYTMSTMEGLKIVNLQTLESKLIEEGPIYCANILKSTGEILYTTINPNSKEDDRYLLVLVNPEDMTKRTKSLYSPTYYLSPAEDKIFFISNYGENEIKGDLLNFDITQSIKKKDDKNISKIKSTILQMFYLDYKFDGSYEDYEKQARKIYTNTNFPVPQEALNNKLTDFKRFNMPLPGIQQESCIPPVLTFDSLLLKGSSASVNIGHFFINSIELIKIKDNWFITGFSTHPESSEVKEVRGKVRDHINHILAGDKKEALKYWEEEEENEFNLNNRKIVENIISIKDKIKIEIGETELWAMSEPHRAESPSSATEARVKISIKEGDNISKYKLVLTRKSNEGFTVKLWDTDPLSVSQLY